VLNDPTIMDCGGLFLPCIIAVVAVVCYVCGERKKNRKYGR
jgi:hypothetical protein